MAPPDNVDNAKSSMSRAAGGRRTGWPMSIDDTSTSILAPFLSNLPSMGARGISSLKGLLPLSPSKRDVLPPDDTFAAWQDADLGDGRRRILLLTSPLHALQVFAFKSGTIPDDQSAQEAFPAPEEVASLPDIVYDDAVDALAFPGVKPVKAPRDERAVSAHLLDEALWGDHGPVVAMITSSGSSRTALTQLALVLVSLKSGKAFRRLDLGSGVTASVTSSSRVVVLSTSHPTPSVYILNKHLESIHTPVSHLPVNPLSHLPIVSVNGRLLAYATREAAAVPGSDGLGSIVAASTARSRAANLSTTPQSPPPPATAQGALLTSAVEIGGGVARGVWSGLKIGARMAGDRLAQSAPAERGLSMPRDEIPAGGSESRSVEEGIPDGTVSPRPAGGVWVKIVDLFPRVSTPNGEPDLIAHFRLPPSRTLVSPLPAQGIRSHAVQREYPIAALSFSPEGSRLFAAAADGRDLHILDVRPRGSGFPHRRGGSKGEVWDAYILRRGNTAADVRTVSWSQDERWIAVGTGKGTVHVFPISPAGGKPTAESHVQAKVANPSQLQPLSIEVTPFARLRPPRIESSEDLPSKADEAKLNAFATAVFVASRLSPISKGSLCQDVAIYRPGIVQMELARLTAHAKAPAATSKPMDVPHQRRGSNLTTMMREKAGLLPEGDLAVEQGLKARWALPLGQGVTEAPVLIKSRASKAPAKPSKPVKSLHHAEIRTHTSNSRILPVSIYLSRQVEFFAAVPTDEYSPLSVLDKVARTRRLVFRPEVEIHPPNAESGSFDKPLSNALHSVMESRLSTQFPQLPNGSPSKGSPFWSSIPIRNVAAGLGEGVHRVRQEYVRAQNQRQRRRTSNAAAANSVSFEDDAVLAARPASEESEDVESSPSSLLPNSSHDGDDDEWGEPWEDEYRRAVEDDGPDDLVLGLLDEEEDERRRWEQRQKDLAKEYQK